MGSISNLGQTTSTARGLVKRWMLPCLFAVSVSAGRSVQAQTGPAGEPPTPKQLAIDAIQNEEKLIHYEQSYLRYRVHTQDAKGDKIRDVIESKDGTVARVIERNQHPVDAEEDAAEHERLQGLLESPSAFEKHIEKDRTGKQMALDLIKLLPEAMIFSMVPGQPQQGELPGGTAADYVLDFKPNPEWKPQTMTSEALTGLEGRCWIDRKTHHLRRMEARVFQGVSFGYGIFAHIYPGGEFVVEQKPVGDQRWMVDHFVEHVTVRVVVKTVKKDTDLQAYEFSPVPQMGYKDAIHMLLGTPLPVGGGSGSGGAAGSK